MSNPMTQNKRKRETAQRERKESKTERRDQRKARQAELKELRKSGIDPDLEGIIPGPQNPL